MKTKTSKYLSHKLATSLVAACVVEGGVKAVEKRRIEIRVTLSA